MLFRNIQAGTFAALCYIAPGFMLWGGLNAQEIASSHAFSGDELAAWQADYDNGSTIYDNACVACHGADAKGVPSLGKDLTTSTFADGLTDEELVSFIIEGRPAGDPLNTTGVDMLPRGGNSGLSDHDLFDVVAYLRTL